MIPWFLATRRFTLENGEAWSKYIHFSGLTQLQEVVALESLLCPKLLTETKAEYWPYVVNEDFLTDFFTDLVDHEVEFVNGTWRTPTVLVAFEAFDQRHRRFS